MIRRPAALALLLALLLGAACARPFKGPKTLAAIGATLLVGGAATWALGERRGRDGAVKGGVIVTAAGAAAAIVAGGWMAAAVACRVDPDCPEDEACKEVPAPPGRDPYRQCLPR